MPYYFRHRSVVLAAITLFACGEATEPSLPPAAPPPPPAGPPVSLVISPWQLSLFVGQEQQMEARAYDSLGRQTTITAIEWSSADTTVATVGRRNGWVRAISAPGGTRVTATMGTLSTFRWVWTFAHDDFIRSGTNPQKPPSHQGSPRRSPAR